MNSSLTQANFITSLRYIISVGTAWAAGKGYITQDAVNAILAGVLIVGPALWGMLDNYLMKHQRVAREAAAVQAGIELVTQGKALAADGTTIVVAHDPGSTPPKPVTVQTAQEIIKDFAPDPKAVAKS